MSAPPECSDEDGGLIYDEKGAVRGQDYETGEEGVFIDYCNSEESLHEYYCLKEDDYEYVYRNNILCYERIPGSECFEGVCVVVECTDSDGGENLEEVGETKGKYGTVGMTTMTDECKSDTEVLEYTCVDEWIQRNTIECPGNKTCTGGVCV